MFPLWVVPVLPLVGGVVILLLPRRRMQYSGGIAATVAGLATALVAVHLAATIRGVQHVSTARLTLAGRVVDVGLAADPLAAVMGLLVALTATLVLIYSVGYMADDSHKRRFFAVMSLFTGAMLSLVLASDYVLLYLSWEIVGLCSYLLIGHYWREQKASRAAFKAFLITRIGDMGLLLAIALVFANIGTARFDSVFATVQSGLIAKPLLTLIAVLIVLGAAGKSAQFPLHWWLPDAMAGPTPVSALIHSATMVAAGIYLLARSFPLLAAVPLARNLLLIAAIVTSIGAALAAAAQTDVKRLLAYSTMSQLGEMGLALAIGVPFAAIFHLIAHASFKALLFLATGIATRAADSNELSSLPGSRIAQWGFLIGALSLSGFPPFAGFWSKAAIAGAAPPAIHVLLASLSALSAFYIGRAFLLGFAKRSQQDSAQPFWETVPVCGLAVLTFVGGTACWWLSDLLGAPRPRLGWTAALDVTLSLTAWAFAAALYHWRIITTLGLYERLAGLRRLVKGGLGTDAVPSALGSSIVAIVRQIALFDSAILDRMATKTAQSVLHFAHGADGIEAQVFDRSSAAVGVAALRMARQTNWWDLCVLDRSVLASAFSLREFGGRVRALQTGRVYHYIAAVFFWVILAGVVTWAVRR